MVPNMESDDVLPLGYSILYKENNLTGLNHKKHYSHGVLLMQGSQQGFSLKELHIIKLRILEVEHHEFSCCCTSTLDDPKP